MLLSEKMNGSLKSSFDLISSESDDVQSNESRSVHISNNNNVNHKKNLTNVHTESKQQQSHHHVKQPISSHLENSHKKTFVSITDSFIHKGESKPYSYGSLNVSYFFSNVFCSFYLFLDRTT